MMKLHITNCRVEEASPRTTAVTEFVQSHNSSDEIATYLSSNFTDDFFEVEDLKCWTLVLERLDSILVEVGAKVNTCSTLRVEAVDENARDIACSVLRFLSFLLKASSDKRYFLSVEPVRHLLRATDIDVAVLASEVLFNLCVPSNSIINSLNDDYYDLVEIPTVVANEALIVFESLSFMSTEFGITDYLHGHQPTFVSLSDAATAEAPVMNLNVRFPPRAEGQKAVDLDINAWGTTDSNQVRTQHLRELQTNHELSVDETWTVLSMRNALYGLQADTAYRLKIVRMRLFCFFMLVHSKIPPAALQEYLKPGSRFLQDLVDLSDICSEASSELSLPRPIAVAYVALENVLGLLENKLRRRSSFVVNSNILPALGLSTGAFGGTPVMGRSEGAWTNIVMSACSIAPVLFNSPAGLGGAAAPSSPNASAAPSPPHFASSPSSPSRLASIVSDQEISSTAKFVRIGLELFALSMTTRETTNVVADTPLISTIVGVVQSALPHVERILTNRHGQGEKFTASTYDTHVLLVASKALYCLELTVERPEYFAAFRESEGIAVLSKVVEIFATVNPDPEGHLTFLDAPARNVLEGALSSLYLSIQKSRHTVILQGNTADTGMRVISEVHFGELCCKLLRSPFHTNELLWAQLLTVVKEAIDLDPSYLSTFLQSSYATALMKLVQIPFGAPFPTELFAPKASTDLESLLVPICRLATAVSITAEGRAFITQSRMLHFVLEAIVQPCSMLPQGREVEAARLIKIGKVLGALMQEHEELKVSIKEQLRKRLVGFAKDAQDSVKPLDRADAAELSSPRIQALQKLADLCVIIENTFTERRSRPDDVVRDILTPSTLEALVLAFPATLPPPSQLLAQVTLRHMSTTAHYGHSAAAKAITSLLKIACAQITHSGVMITLLGREIDQQLNTLNAVVQLLPSITSSSEQIDVQVACSVFGKGDSSFKGGTVKHAPTKSTNVQLVGVLDHFPQRCTMDPAFAQSLFEGRADGLDCTYKYFTSVMTFEWLSMLLSQAIRAEQRSPHSKQIDSVKDTLKSMFAFHKSSLMEMSRVSAGRWFPKPFSDSRFKKTLQDALCRCDSSEDSVFIPRLPTQYQLRVAGSGGALVREGIEIEGTRVILTADVGSSLVAFERRTNEAGVLRYRTMHGWISEFRRDHQRSPIVELMGLPVLSQADIDLERAQRDAPATEAVQQERLAMEAVTLREAAFLALCKANTSMRQVAGYLARAMFNPENVGLSRGSAVQTASAIAPSLSLTLSKVIKGIVQLPRQCLPDSALPEGLQELQASLSEPASSEDLNLLGDLDPIETQLMSSFDRFSVSGSQKATSSSAQKGRKNKSRSTDEDESAAEPVEIDVGAACLYYASAVKQIIVPMLEDKNGNMNVLLLRSLCNQGGVAALVDAFALTVLVLKREIEAADASSKGELSGAGRCAYYALPNLLAVLQRLVNRELLNKSIATGSPALSDEIGAYQAHELVYQLLSAVHKQVLPLLQSGALTSFPVDVQYEWLGVVAEFVRNLSTPLPAPTSSRTSYSTAGRHAIGHPEHMSPAQLAGMFNLMGGPGSHSPMTRSDRSESRSERRAAPSTLPPARAAPASPARAPMVADPDAVRALSDMGFENEHILHTINALRSSNIDTLIQYMFNHPWSPPEAVPAAAAAAAAGTTAGIAESAAESGSPVPSSPVPMAEPLTTDTQLPPAPVESDTATLPPQPPSAAQEVAAETPQQSNYLPNLVPDLDEADGSGSPVVDHSADAPDPVAPPATEQLPHSPALRELAMQRFQSDMSVLLDHALPRGLATPMTGADEQLGRTGSNRPSSQRSPYPRDNGMTEPNPNGAGSSLREKEREDSARDGYSHYRDFNAVCQRVSGFAKQIGGLFVPMLLDICSQYDQLGRWSTKESHVLITLMVELLLKLNTAETPVKYVPLANIFADLVSRITAEATEADHAELKLQGLLYFLLQFIVDGTVRKQLVDSGVLSREKCGNLVALLTKTLHRVMQDSSSLWPKWVNPAMLLFYEFLSLPSTSQPSKDCDPSSRGGSAWDSKDEKGDLVESKTGSEEQEQKATRSGIDASTLMLNQVLLLPETVRLDLFDLTVRLVDAALRSKPLPSETQNSTFAVLVSLLSNQKFVTRFVAGNGVENVLSLCSRETSLESRATQGRVLTLIVQRCLETEIELEQAFAGHMRDVHRGNTAEDKCLPFNTFIQSLTPDLLRSPEEFWQACKHTVKIVKVQTATRKDESGAESKSEVKVRLLEKEQLDDFLAQRSRYGEADSRAYTALRAVLNHIVTTAKVPVVLGEDASVDEKLASKSRVNAALDAVADSILSLKRAPILAAKLIKSESENLGLAAGENLVDFLISKFFADTLVVPSDTAVAAPAKSQANPDLVASSRVLVALCAFKGTSRIITLNSIVKHLRQHAVATSGRLKASAGDSSVGTVSRTTETKRVMMLSRLASLIGIIIRASKTTPRDGVSQKGQGVSVDTLHYLIEHGHILKLLTQALNGIPMSVQASAGAVSAIVDLIELITRPKIQAHLDKLSEQAANEKSDAKATSAANSFSQLSEGDMDAQNSSAEHGAEELFMIGADDHAFGRSSSQQSHSPGTAMLQEAGFRPFGHNAAHSDEEEEGGEDDEDESESSEGSEGSEESSSSSEDEEGDDDSDDDDADEEEGEEEEYDEEEGSEEDEDEEEDEEAAEMYGAEEGDEGDEMEEDEEGPDMLEEHMRQLEQDVSFDFGQLDDAYVNVESVLNSRDERQSIIDQLENAVFAREMDDPHMRNTTFVTPPMRGGGGADFQFIMNGLNDPNIDIADIMRRLTSGQPIRGLPGFPGQVAISAGGHTGAEHGAGMAELLPQGVAAALEVTPSFAPHQLFGADPLAASLHPSRPGAYPGAPLGRRNAFDGRTDPRVQVRPTQGSPWTYVEGEEFNPAMPAMWPRSATGVPLRTAGQRPTAPANASEPSNSMAELVLRQLESNLIEGVDVVEESAGDEVSQGSFTESRGDGPDNGDGGLTEGGGSFTSSNIALQDPNPRRRGDDSRQGDPIPPIIEIDTPDHEGNEELSVITLPQEEAGQAIDHEDSTSVSSAQHEMQRFLGQHARSTASASASPPRSPLRAAPRSDSAPASPAPVTRVATTEAAVANPEPILATTMSVERAINGLSFDALLLSLVAAPPAPAPVAAPVAAPEPVSTPTPADVSEQPADAPVASGGDERVPDLLSDSSDSSDDEETRRHRSERAENNASQIASPSAEPTSASGLATTTSAEEEISATALGAAAQGPVVLDNSSPMLVDLTGTASTEDGEAEGEEEVEEEQGAEGRLACPAGYDAEVFYSLPEDMQLEIIEQHGETVDQTRALIEAAGLDYDAIASLPENIRQEVLEQARRDQAEANGASAGASGGGGSSQEMDNANFLASLTLELRTEVLLTANADFLNTLPPELVAEAQRLREQAASTWQRRELMSRASARESANANAAAAAQAQAARQTAAGGMGVGMGGQFYGEEGEDEEDEDGMDDMDMGRGPGFFSGGSRPRRPKTEPPKTGLMRVPESQSWSMKIPRHLVVAIAKMILQAPKQPSRSTAAFRILQNVSGALRAKDLNMRLLIGLISNNKELLNTSLQLMCGADADASMLQDGVHATKDAIAKPTVNSGRKISADSEVEVTSHSAQRIVAVLSQLVTNNAFVYLLLSERDSSFAIADKEAVARLEAIRPTSTDKDKVPAAEAAEASVTVADGAEEVVTKPSGDSEGNTSPSRIGRGARPATGESSTNSLLERIICLFAKNNVTGSAAELDSVTNLLSVVTSPLEYLQDETSAQAAPPVGVVTAEMLARDARQHMVTLPVPRVVLSKESLRFLCDVLLNDHCSKRVLGNVTSTISRLSKVYSNHSQLLELIVDVIIDLADQSHFKLEVLAASLQQIHVKYTQAQKEKGQEKATVASGTPGKGRPGNLKVSGDEAGSSSPMRASASSSAMAAKSALPTSLLPLGESGGKQHERLLRVVQTLQSMAVKTNRQLSEVTPSDELSDLWGGLDQVLQQLRHYLVDLDEAESGEQDGTETTRPQSALTSILNRLLPAIEAFFLVHATDFLVEKPRSAEKSSSEPSGAAAVPVSTATTPGTAAAAEQPAAAGDAFAAAPLSAHPNTSELIPLSSMPGHSYRTSAAYLRNNLTLFAADGASSGSLDEAAPFQSSRSLRKQPSLTSMNSRNFSVLTTRAHRLLHFVQSNKGLLNLLVKAKPALLDDSFSAFVRITQLRACLKFDNKRKYFFTQLKRSNQSVSRRGVHLQIRRSQVFEDSYHQLRSRTAEELRGRLQVNFYGEEGVDAGGLSREWYVILAREIFNPNYALFMAAVDGATFQPNPLSMINTNHLDYFKFVGRLIGKAICDGQLLDAHFTRSFYKHLLGMPVDFQDIEATEPDYYKTLRQVLDTPLDLLMMDLTFSAEIQRFGNTEVVDLIPNGRNILVTDDNKADYIRLIAHHRMTSAIRAQIDSFLQGFYDLVPAELVCVFSPAELELLICGLPDVNVAELQANTEYHQYRAGDEVIVWFWDALKSLNREERASFLQFVTGTSKVPLGGFANLQGMRGTQKFSIHKAYGDAGLLPTAHTCFNQLDLPAYSSAEELKEKLLMAITEGAEGFGFA